MHKDTVVHLTSSICIQPVSIKEMMLNKKHDPTYLEDDESLKQSKLSAAQILQNRSMPLHFMVLQPTLGSPAGLYWTILSPRSYLKDNTHMI